MYLKLKIYNFNCNIFIYKEVTIMGIGKSFIYIIKKF